MQRDAGVATLLLRPAPAGRGARRREEVDLVPLQRLNPKVDAFMSGARQWRREYERLREIALACDLAEEFKWMHPCYTADGRNIVLIHGFKEYCALLFFKGALLPDPHGILVRQTENVQSGRQVRFRHIGEVEALEHVLAGYIHEAVRVERSGLKVEQRGDAAVPPEFQVRLEATPALKAAFGSLTPGRRRAYALYFSEPKLPATRESRIDRCLERIRDGKGLND